MDREFDGNVGHAAATIEQLWTSSSGKKGTDYEVRSRYGVDGGQVVESDSSVSRATYCQLHIGEQVPVKYLPQDRAKSRIDWPLEEKWNWHKDEIVTAFGLFFTAVGALVAYLGWRRTNGREPSRGIYRSAGL